MLEPEPRPLPLQPSDTPFAGVEGRGSVDYLLRNVHQQLVQLSVPGLVLVRPLLLVTHERGRSPALERFSRFTRQFARARRSAFEAQAPR